MRHLRRERGVVPDVASHTHGRVGRDVGLEAEAAARLQHPHILTVHDSGEYAPDAILPYLQGRLLAQVDSKYTLVIMAAIPAVVALLGRAFLGERITARTGMAIACAAAGIALLAWAREPAVAGAPGSRAPA